MDFIQISLIVLGCLAVLVGLRLLYVWNTRIRPLEPSLELEWAADCERRAGDENLAIRQRAPVHLTVARLLFNVDHRVSISDGNV